MYVFPTRLFNPPTLDPQIIGAAQSGGRSLSGIPQFADLSGGGYWSINFPNIPLTTRAKIMAWRALSAAASTGTISVLVPLADRLHQPLNVTAYSGADPFGLSIWDDNDPWTAVPGEVSSTLAGGTGIAGAALIDILYASGQTLIGGEHFSVQSIIDGIWRLHIVTRVISHSGVDYSLEIRPPLRETYGDGKSLNFDSPRCTMRLDGEMRAPLDLLKRAVGSVRFVEDFPPPSGGGDSPADSPP